MHHLKVLNTREAKKIREFLKKHYGAKNLLEDYVFMENNKGRIFIITRDYEKTAEMHLRTNRIGMYFAKRHPDGIRLSIEGAQMIGATKNIVRIKDAKKWAMGFDQNTDDKGKGYVIVKHGKDILGCGKWKEGKVINFTPKDRRIAKEDEIKTYKCCKANIKKL